MVPFFGRWQRLRWPRVEKVSLGGHASPDPHSVQLFWRWRRLRRPLVGKAFQRLCLPQLPLGEIFLAVAVAASPAKRLGFGHLA